MVEHVLLKSEPLVWTLGTKKKRRHLWAAYQPGKCWKIPTSSSRAMRNHALERWETDAPKAAGSFMAPGAVQIFSNLWYINLRRSFFWLPYYLEESIVAHQPFPDAPFKDVSSYLSPDVSFLTTPYTSWAEVEDCRERTPIQTLLHPVEGTEEEWCLVVIKVTGGWGTLRWTQCYQRGLPKLYWLSSPEPQVLRADTLRIDSSCFSQ